MNAPTRGMGWEWIERRTRRINCTIVKTSWVATVVFLLPHELGLIRRVSLLIG